MRPLITRTLVTSLALIAITASAANAAQKKPRPHPAHAARQTVNYYDSSPTYDAAPLVTTSPADETAAQIQEMNNENAMIQSMQAAQQQNDAAQAQFNADMAATIQTEINANQ